MDSLASTGKLRRALSGPRSRELKGLDFLCNFWHRGDRSGNTEGDCALKKIFTWKLLPVSLSVPKVDLSSIVTVTSKFRN